MSNKETDGHFPSVVGWSVSLEKPQDYP